MEIKRDLYLKNLIFYMWDGQVKLLSRPDEIAKMDYLKALILEVYLKDIVERKKNQAGRRAVCRPGSFMFLCRIAYQSE